jgi:uncharacterized protein YraI
MKKIGFPLMLFILLASACVAPEPVATPTATTSPSALPTTIMTLATTPLKASLTATPLFVVGTLTIKVNVRSGPGTSFTSLGQLDVGEKVQVIARDSPGAWYLILFSVAPQGRGWVASQYVTVGAGTGIPLDATPTQVGPTGHLLQRLNVRTGPGTTYTSLGVLESGSVVSLTGRNVNSSWFQIEFPFGSDRRGWVTTQYVEQDSSAALPIMDENGQVVTPNPFGTPSGPVLPPTPTVGTAYLDNDSSINPANRITFSVSGIHQFVYSSQVSMPEGDAVDWLEFVPYTTIGTMARLIISLICSGNGNLTMELWQGGTLLSGWGSITCGETGKLIRLPAGQDYQISLTPSHGEGLHLVAYTLTIKNDP